MSKGGFFLSHFVVVVIVLFFRNEMYQLVPVNPVNGVIEITYESTLKNPNMASRVCAAEREGESLFI